MQEQFSNPGLIADAEAIKKGSVQQMDFFNFSVYGTSENLPPNISPATATRVTLGSPANSMTLLPVALGPGVDEDSQKLSSSPTAIIMVRFNGTGPWIGMGLPGTQERAEDIIFPFCFAGTISFIDWFVLTPDTTAGAVILGIFGRNVGGSINITGPFGSYVAPTSVS